MRVRKTIIPLFVALMLSSCAYLPFTNGGEQVVDRFPSDPPDWLNSPFELKGDRFYVVGRALKVYSMAECIHMARDNAREDLLKGLGERARSEFLDAVRDAGLPKAELDQNLNTLASLTSEHVKIHGNWPDNTYEERIMVGDLPHPKFYFNCEVRISYPIQNYERARKVALSSFKTNAKGKVAETIGKLADKKFGDQEDQGS